MLGAAEYWIVCTCSLDTAQLHTCTLYVKVLLGLNLKIEGFCFN